MRVFLKEWRLHLNLTQEEIAERLGTSKGTVSRLELNTREPNLGYLAAFAEAIGRNTGQLFYDPRTPSCDDLLRNVSPAQADQAFRMLKALTETYS